MYIYPPFPRYIPPQMAPLILGVSLVIRYRFLPVFRTFLGEYSSMLLFDMHADFFCRIDLQRNRFIKRVELFEESPILLLLRWLEASEW